MPKFNAKLLGRSESIENKENKNWWQVLPLITIVIVFLVYEILDRYRSKSQ